MLRVAFWQETRKQPEHLGYTPLEIDRRITADFRMSAHGPSATSWPISTDDNPGLAVKTDKMPV